MTQETYGIIIVGAGPAGLTAGIYAARIGLKTLILEEKLLGGRAIEAAMVENFPGFPALPSPSLFIDEMQRRKELYKQNLKASPKIVLLARLKKHTPIWGL